MGSLTTTEPGQWQRPAGWLFAVTSRSERSLREGVQAVFLQSMRGARPTFVSEKRNQPTDTWLMADTGLLAIKPVLT
ncbi:MAG: hypothetical protein D6690_13405 [Nitrospirae bacterium]|nr:MAG: hypothetical protein D6690_13405 [Nitrospirota bacterium]